MRPIRCYIFFTFLLYSLFGSAQNQAKIDSLLQVLTTDISDRHKVDVYVEIANSYDALNFEKIKMYGNKAITLAKKSNYIEGRIDALNQIGNGQLTRLKNEEAEQLYLNMLDLAYKNNYTKGRAEAYRGLGRASRKMGKRDQAIEYFFESLNLYKHLGDKRKQGISYNDIGLVYELQGNTNEAVEHFFLSINLCKEIGYNQGIAIAYMNLGSLYRDSGNFDKAIDYFSRSIELHKIGNKKTREANGYANLGRLFTEKKEYNKALEYYFKSLKINKEYKVKRYKVAATYSRIANVYLNMKDYKVALDYCFKSLKIYEDISMNSRKPSALYRIGKVYRFQNQLKLARDYTNQGIIVARQHGLLEDIRYGYKQLGLIEKKDGNYKKALKANALYIEMTDSLHDNEEIKMIAILNEQYKFRKTRDSLQLVMDQELLSNKKKIQQGKTRSIIIYIMVGSIFMIGIGCFMIIQKSIQRKKYQLLRNRISRDLHDEIGSTLSSIAMYGTVAEKELISKPEKAKNLIQRINSYAIMSIESMNDIVWSIKSENETLEGLVKRIRFYLSEIEQTGNWQTSIKYNKSILNCILDAVNMRNLFLIVKESINNSIKHSNGNSIDVRFFAEATNEKAMVVEVEDNGFGFDIETLDLVSSNGIVNMQKRAEDLNGTLEFITLKNKGFKIKLIFKKQCKSR